MYYWFAILENVCFVLAVLFIICSIFGVLLFVGLCITDEDDYERLKSIAKWLYPIYFIITLFGIFTPSQKQLAFIIAAPYIVENQELRDASKNTAEIIKLGTEYIKETLKGKNNADRN